MELPRQCLGGCGDLVRGRQRCTVCARRYEADRGEHRGAYHDPAYRSIPLGGVCHLCGQPGADTRDHLVPLSLGGSNDPSNIAPAHRACNSRKGNR